MYWWETFLTDHQAYTTAELARAAGQAIDVLCVEEENTVRRNQGWVLGQQAGLRLTPFPERWIRFIWTVIKNNPDAVHVFAGPFGSLRLTLAMLVAAVLKRRLYLLTEPYSPVASGYLDDDAPIHGLVKSKLRPLLYLLYGLIFKRRIEGVFAISPRAIAQLHRMGVPPEKIFPFAYFVPSTDNEPFPAAPVAPRVIFVGTLNRTKGVDILVVAAQLLEARGTPVAFDVYGYGDKERFGLDTPTVKYRGLIPFGQAQDVMKGYSLLVLPSRYDGWGVVVNEAVLAGVPVVCSNNVGASAMVKAWGCGLVYEGGAAALADSIARVVTNPDQLNAMRTSCRQLQPFLGPAVGGRYLFDVITRKTASQQQFTNPWY